VHAYHDYRHQRGPYRMSSSVINSMTLNSLTTIIGFGSMMVADHRGLASLGLVLTIGCGCSLFVSLVLVPSFLTLVSRRGQSSEIRFALAPPEIIALAAGSAASGDDAGLKRPPAQMDECDSLPKAG
jgi:hypothetical protein